MQDFDLCVSCYETTKHEHPMERLGLGVMDPEDQESASEQNPQVGVFPVAMAIGVVVEEGGAKLRPLV